MRNITISEILRTILYTNILHFSAFCKCPFSALAFFHVLVHKTSTSLFLFPDPGMNSPPAPIGPVLRRLPFAEDARPNHGNCPNVTSLRTSSTPPKRIITSQDVNAILKEKNRNNQNLIILFYCHFKKVTEQKYFFIETELIFPISS